MTEVQLECDFRLKFRTSKIFLGGHHCSQSVWPERGSQLDIARQFVSFHAISSTSQRGGSYVVWEPGAFSALRPSPDSAVEQILFSRQRYLLGVNFCGCLTVWTCFTCFFSFSVFLLVCARSEGHSAARQLQFCCLFILENAIHIILVRLDRCQKYLLWQRFVSFRSRCHVDTITILVTSCRDVHPTQFQLR